MSQKSLQKIESKERILNVASRLFKKHGYAATGIDQIMNEAGLTAGGFYAHFKSKTDLLEQSIEHSLNNSRQLLIRDTEHLTGNEKIKTIMARYISLLHRDLPEKGCILPALASEIYRGTKNSNEIIGKYIIRWANFLAQNMTGPESQTKKNESALNLISQAVGAVLLSRMVKESKLSDEIINSARQTTASADLTDAQT